MYNRHYHFAGKALRDFPCWYQSIRDEWTGRPYSLYYSDDGFGNLILLSEENYLNLVRYRYYYSH